MSTPLQPFLELAGGDSERAIEAPLRIVPVTFREACAFVSRLHRHLEKPPRGTKFCVGVVDDSGALRGVAMCGRPIARCLQDGFTIEVNRTCTDGAANANSMLYGACRAVAKALGYRRVFTYTQEGESGASLRAAGFVREVDLPARGSWADSTGPGALREMRDRNGAGGVARVRWSVTFGSNR